MISKDTQTFLQGDRLNKVFSLCKRILGDEKTAEKDCQSATKLLSIMLQNCRGKIDQCVFAFLELVVKRLSIARSDALKILLLDTVYTSDKANSNFYTGCRCANLQSSAYYFES